MIAAEVQCFGANSFATIFRGGKGVEYKEVLIDVCDKMKVNFNKNSSVEVIEQNLLMKILKDSFDKMSTAEVRQLAESLGVKNFNSVTAESLVGGFQTIFKMGGFKSYQLSAIIVNAVMKALIGRGLSFVATGTLMRAASVLTGPIGWAITGIWTAVDLAGAAYRVTIPAVIQIAFLRQKVKYADLADEIQF